MWVWLAFSNSSIATFQEKWKCFGEILPTKAVPEASRRFGSTPLVWFLVCNWNCADPVGLRRSRKLFFSGILLELCRVLIQAHSHDRGPPCLYVTRKGVPAEVNVRKSMVPHIIQISPIHNSHTIQTILSPHWKKVCRIRNTAFQIERRGDDCIGRTNAVSVIIPWLSCVWNVRSFNRDKFSG